MTDQPGEPAQTPKFNPGAEHHLKPRIRKVRGFPLQAKGPDGQPAQMLGLADAQQISSKMVATLPAAQLILPQMDGSRGIDEIVSSVGRGLTRDFLEQLIAQLDDAGLLEGPIFNAMYEKVKADFDSTDNLPPGSSIQFAEALVMQELGQEATDEQKTEQAPIKLRQALDKWIDESLKNADDPAFDELPVAVVVPHIDYPRGWINYGQVYGRLRTATRPDRVVILGTNHFGFATGVCGCDKGFETPFGTSPLDSALFEALKARLGEDGTSKLLEHRYDHEREHSIELQIPWIQHCIGEDEQGNHCPVLGVLVHDPIVNGGSSYDGNGLDFDPFVEALRGALQDVGGTTLVISSADLSHVGPAFGDQQPLAGDTEESKSERDRVLSHDQEMIAILTDNKPDDLIASMSWQQNPTRWCSIGNLTATMRVTQPESVRLLNYAGAVDAQGMSLVSHAAMAMS